MLNKQKGNMYGFVTHTWNPIKGICSHDCSYCYMKVWKQKQLHLSEKELKDNLGSDNFIFVGSSTDMFAEDVPKEWIFKVLEVCNKFPNNKYLFQTKNPKRFHYFMKFFPKNLVLGITIETNHVNDYEDYSKAPLPLHRLHEFDKIPEEIEKMITIEPIMDFEEATFKLWIKEAKPMWVNIGADSKNHKLPEPSWDKVQMLIKELEKFTEVKIKDNLTRLQVT